MIKSILKIYFNITASILILFTGYARIDDLITERQSIESYQPISPFIAHAIIFFFKFCFINMFILFAVGIVAVFKKNTIKYAVFYILAAFFFLAFFMGFSDWDRF